MADTAAGERTSSREKVYNGLEHKRKGGAGLRRANGW